MLVYAVETRDMHNTSAYISPLCYSCEFSPSSVLIVAYLVRIFFIGYARRQLTKAIR
jgi:hypothetical protein